MGDLSNIIERVQKLLALSKSTNANEAAAANKLIDQHRLSEADLEGAGEVSEPVEEDASYIYESGRINPWKALLVRVLVNHYGLACWNDAHWNTGRMVSRYRLVGRKSDITISKYMFAWLTAECQRLSDLEAKGKGKVYCNSYCMGFVRGVEDQLRASRVEVQKTATSTAIVKIDARAEEAEEFLNTAHSNLRYKKSLAKSRLDADAYQAGKKGENLHLGASLGEGGTKLLGK